jgi:hypothetical protein
VQAGSITTSITTDDDEPMERCDQIKMRFGDWSDPMPMARSEQQLKVSRSEASPLVLRLSAGAGMRIHTWDRDDYSIVVCKVAGARTSEKAQRSLDAIAVSMQEGRFSARGPEAGNWLVYLIVKAQQRRDGLETRTARSVLSLRKRRARSETAPSTPLLAGDPRHHPEQPDQHLRRKRRIPAEGRGPISVGFLSGGWKGRGGGAHRERPFH